MDPFSHRSSRIAREGLNIWTTTLVKQENVRRFTPEQAKLIVQEDKSRVTAIAGKIAQAAAQLGVKL